jgi:hypothetical protein
MVKIPCFDTDLYRIHGMQLYCGKGKLVREAVWECLGVGDSSVIRYLVSVLSYPAPTVLQCLIFGFYIVEQAKQFIAQCGGPTQGIIITKDGSVRTPNFGGVDFHKMESKLSELLWTVSRLHTPYAQIELQFRRFEVEVRAIRWSKFEII